MEYRGLKMESGTLTGQTVTGQRPIGHERLIRILGIPVLSKQPTVKL